MTATISRLYNNYDDAKSAVANLEAAGVAHNDISIIARNADSHRAEVGTDIDRSYDYFRLGSARERPGSHSLGALLRSSPRR